MMYTTRHTVIVTDDETKTSIMVEIIDDWVEKVAESGVGWGIGHGGPAMGRLGPSGEASDG